MNNQKKQVSTLLLILFLTFPSGTKAQVSFIGDSVLMLRNYDQDHLLNIALPLGGIGTGTVSLAPFRKCYIFSTYPFGLVSLKDTQMLRSMCLIPR